LGEPKFIFNLPAGGGGRGIQLTVKIVFTHLTANKIPVGGEIPREDLACRYVGEGEDKLCKLVVPPRPDMLTPTSRLSEWVINSQNLLRGWGPR